MSVVLKLSFAALRRCKHTNVDKFLGIIMVNKGFTPASSSVGVHMGFAHCLHHLLTETEGISRDSLQVVFDCLFVIAVTRPERSKASILLVEGHSLDLLIMAEASAKKEVRSLMVCNPCQHGPID
jgi:hypothetical protein